MKYLSPIIDSTWLHQRSTTTTFDINNAGVLFRGKRVVYVMKINLTVVTDGLCLIAVCIWHWNWWTFQWSCCWRGRKEEERERETETKNVVLIFRLSACVSRCLCVCVSRCVCPAARTPRHVVPALAYPDTPIHLPSPSCSVFCNGFHAGRLAGARPV